MKIKKGKAETKQTIPPEDRQTMEKHPYPLLYSLLKHKEITRDSYTIIPYKDGCEDSVQAFRKQLQLFTGKGDTISGLTRTVQETKNSV